ncbi:MAG TPA: nuclear transport factor 2 family protein [Caulobacteraceae bacterium]
MAAALGVGGQASAGDDANAGAKAQLAALEREWVGAEVNRDPAPLVRILDDQFVCTFLTSKPVGKSDFIRLVTRPGPTESQDISDETVIVIGDTAVIVETDTARGVRDGTPYTNTLRVTVTYIQRHGHWRALAEHLAWGVTPPAPAAS